MTKLVSSNNRCQLRNFHLPELEKRYAGFGACQLVWVLLFPNHSSCSCCCRSSRKPGSHNYRVLLVQEYIGVLLAISHLSLISAFTLRFAETGQALVSSVDKIIFVGSPGVGKMVVSFIIIIVDYLFWLQSCVIFLVGHVIIEDNVATNFVLMLFVL